jgi:hypothetical protein
MSSRSIGRMRLGGRDVGADHSASEGEVLRRYHGHDDEHVGGTDAQTLFEQADQRLVEPALGPLTTVQVVADREHDPVIGAWAAAEAMVEDHLARVVLVDEPEVVVGLHVQLGDQRVVHRLGDSGEILFRLSASQRDVDEGHLRSSLWPVACAVSYQSCRAGRVLGGGPSADQRHDQRRAPRRRR